METGWNNEHRGIYFPGSLDSWKIPHQLKESLPETEGNAEELGLKMRRKNPDSVVRAPGSSHV